MQYLNKKFFIFFLNFFLNLFRCTRGGHNLNTPTGVFQIGVVPPVVIGSPQKSTECNGFIETSNDSALWQEISLQN